MIAKEFRFSGRAGLNPVYRRGQTYRNPYFSVRVYKNEKNSNYRLAVVVSKKTAKLSTTRNLIRRRVYELVRANQSLIIQPFDMVITVFSDAVANMPQKELEKNLIKLLKTANILS